MVNKFLSVTAESNQMDSNWSSTTNNRRNPYRARRMCLLFVVHFWHCFNATKQRLLAFISALLLLFIALITFVRMGSYLLRQVESFTRSFLILCKPRWILLSWFRFRLKLYEQYWSKLLYLNFGLTLQKLLCWSN